MPLTESPRRGAWNDPCVWPDNNKHSVASANAQNPNKHTGFGCDTPKMPGEPPRVQPSKKVAAHWDDDGNRVSEQPPS
jgi:hypothetical protein